MKCRDYSYQFDPSKEDNSRKRKCGMCCFGDSYSIKSKKKYEKNMLFTIIESLPAVGIKLKKYYKILNHK